MPTNTPTINLQSPPNPHNSQNQPQIFCNNPEHQILAEQIYKRGLELLEEKEHTENLLYNISEAVVAVNKDFNINIINKPAEDLLQVTTSQVEGKKLGDLLSLETEEGQKVTPQDYCFKGADVLLQNLVFDSSYGKKYLKLQSTNIKNPQNQEECIITLTDVTREKLLEKSKDEFISIASHELRTPMTIIKSYIWMLENSKYGSLTDKQKDYLAKAKNGVERMLNMINDTLNTSKIDQGGLQLKIEELDIRRYLDGVTQDFSIKAGEKGLGFSVEIGQGCQYVFADRGKLQEMLVNLLGNSIKFTTTGWIKLAVTNQSDGFLRFTVTDTGKGIDPQDVKRLFHKFGRIDNSYQTIAESGGTGLGLYIVKNMVETMGGEVGVASEGLGKGSTFWFTLPGSYDKVPEKLRENSVMSLASVVETHVTSICPL